MLRRIHHLTKGRNHFGHTKRTWGWVTTLDHHDNRTLERRTVG